MNKLNEQIGLNEKIGDMIDKWRSSTRPAKTLKGDFEDLVADGKNGFLVASVPFDAIVTSLQCGAFGTRGGQSRLDQQSAQIRIPAACLAGPALASAFHCDSIAKQALRSPRAIHYHLLSAESVNYANAMRSYAAKLNAWVLDYSEPQTSIAVRHKASVLRLPDRCSWYCRGTCWRTALGADAEIFQSNVLRRLIDPPLEVLRFCSSAMSGMKVLESRFWSSPEPLPSYFSGYFDASDMRTVILDYSEPQPSSCLRSGILPSDFQFLRSMLDSQAKIENRTLNFEIVRPFSKLNARFCNWASDFGFRRKDWKSSAEFWKRAHDFRFLRPICETGTQFGNRTRESQNER
jgi:hypothetical protein